MKAYRLFEWQKPAKLVDVDIPEPGPGEVRIKVAGNGICGSDLHLMHDWKESPKHINIELPMTIGHEVGGYIDKLGPGVQGLTIGKPALVTIAGCGQCSYCAQGYNQYCLNKGKQTGMGLDGGLAEYAIAPAGGIVEVDNFDPIATAPLTDAGLSSYHAVKRVLPLLKPGSVIGIIGVGGLGHLAIQEIKAISAAKVVAFVLGENEVDFAKENGADEVRISNIDNVEPLSFEAFIDFVGIRATMELAAKAIKPLGHIVIVGRGKDGIEFKDRALPYGAMMSTTFGGTRAELIELIELAKKGLIKPHITKYKLSDIEKAFDDLRNGRIKGRGVIIPD